MEAVNEPTFRIMSKPTPGANVRSSQQPLYACQAPGCGETSNTIACARHLFMLPISVKDALTNAMVSGDAGIYAQAMREAMNVWTTEPD